MNPFETPVVSPTKPRCWAKHISIVNRVISNVAWSYFLAPSLNWAVGRWGGGGSVTSGQRGPTASVSATKKLKTYEIAEHSQPGQWPWACKLGIRHPVLPKNSADVSTVESLTLNPRLSRAPTMRL